MLIESSTYTDAIFKSLSVPTGRGEERNPVQITGAWPSGRGPGACLCCQCFCLSRKYLICRLYKQTLSDQSHVTLQLKRSLSDLAWGCSAGDPEKKFIHRGLNPRPAAVITYHWLVKDKTTELSCAQRFLLKFECHVISTSLHILASRGPRFFFFELRMGNHSWNVWKSC